MRPEDKNGEKIKCKWRMKTYKFKTTHYNKVSEGLAVARCR